jgi:hypothetical protein
MKNYVLAALVAAQTIVASQPAAARPEETSAVQTGTYAGARIRLSLGGKQQDRKFRAGLTLAPTLRSQTNSGQTRTRFGEGLELGFTGERSLTLSLAGRPVSHLVPGGSKSEDERRLGISTVGVVAIGAGVALVVGAVLFADAVEDSRENDPS